MRGVTGLWRAACAALAYATASMAGPCADRATVVDALTGDYGERAQGFGLTRTGELMEVFANPETGSWSIVITTPDGSSCFGSVGDNFTVAPPAVAGAPG